MFGNGIKKEIKIIRIYIDSKTYEYSYNEIKEIEELLEAGWEIKGITERAVLLYRETATIN